MAKRPVKTAGRTVSVRQQARVNCGSQTRLFTSLGVTTAANEQAVTNLLREVYDAGTGDLRSSIHRNRVRQEIRDRMDQMPNPVQAHSEGRDSVVDMLYNLYRLLRARWVRQPATKTVGPPPAPVPGPAPAPAETTVFDPSGPSAVPDADVQIIAYNNPGQPLPIRLSDLLSDGGNLSNRSLNGDWVNASAIGLDGLRQNLVAEGYMTGGASLWFSPHALNDIDPLVLAAPQLGETRLTSMNLASTIVRAIGTYFPSHRLASPENDGTPRSPLMRPSFTIIIRPRTTGGGALDPQQPDLARPGSRRGSMDRPETSTTVPRTETGDAGALPTVEVEAPGPRRPDRKRVTTTGTPSTPKVPVAPKTAALPKDPVGPKAVPAVKAPAALTTFPTFKAPFATSTVPLPSFTSVAPAPPVVPTSGPIPSTVAGLRRPRDPEKAEPSDRPTQRPRLDDDNTDIGMDVDPSTVHPRRPVGGTRARQSVRRKAPIRLGGRAPVSSGSGVLPKAPEPPTMKAAVPASDGQQTESVISGGTNEMSLMEALDQVAMKVALPPSEEQPTTSLLSHLNNDLFEQVGEPWLGIPESRMAPEIQEALRSQRFTADIAQSTDEMDLTGEPKGSSSTPTPDPAPVVTSGPTGLWLPQAEDDMIIATRKRVRRFNEYQERPTSARSDDSQDSLRKTRRLNKAPPTGLNPSPPPPVKAVPWVKRAAAKRAWAKLPWSAKRPVAKRPEAKRPEAKRPVGTACAAQPENDAEFESIVESVSRLTTRSPRAVRQKSKSKFSPSCKQN